FRQTASERVATAIDRRIGTDDVSRLLVPEIALVETDRNRLRTAGSGHRIEVLGNQHHRTVLAGAVRREVAVGEIVETELAEQRPVVVVRPGGADRSLPVRRLPHPVEAEVELV